MSLVPSLTELAWALGAGERLVGRTRFCTEPAEMTSTVPAYGGTKDPDIDAILAAKPTLVLTNREENRREDVEALEQAGVKVHVTDPATVLEAAQMVLAVGTLIGAKAAAGRLAGEIREASSSADGSLRVFVPIWWRPLMGMGGDTYGSDILRCAGGINVLADRERYPEIQLDEVAATAPDVILLPDEPFRFQERHRAPFEAIAPALLVDGKLLWWYGPRIPAAIRTLREVLEPFVTRT